jgi:hypothetical protein
MKALTDLQDKLQTLNDNMIDFVIQILRLHETDKNLLAFHEFSVG